MTPPHQKTKKYRAIDDTLEKVGTNIRTFRKKRQLTQTELGDLLGLDQAAVSRIENGRQSLTLGQLFFLSRFFEIEMSRFLM